MTRRSELLQNTKPRFIKAIMFILSALFATAMVIASIICMVLCFLIIFLKY